MPTMLIDCKSNNIEKICTSCSVRIEYPNIITDCYIIYFMNEYKNLNEKEFIYQYSKDLDRSVGCEEYIIATNKYLPPNLYNIAQKINILR